MKSMQRQFGKMMTRSTDESNVAVLLRDFAQADTLLSKVRRHQFGPQWPYPTDDVGCTEY